MRSSNDWRFPTNPHSRHRAAEVTRLAQRQEEAAQDIDRWRGSVRSKRGGARLAWLRNALLSVLLIVGFLALAYFASEWLLARVYQDRIYPQVVAGDVAVGSLTEQEAANRLNARLRQFNDSPVTLRFGNSIWQPTLEDLGVTVNVDATVARALTAGRSAPVLPEAIAVMLGRASPVTVPVVVAVDPSQLDNYMSDLDKQIGRDPTPPVLQVNTDSVSLEGGGPGYTFLKSNAESVVISALHTLEPQTVQLPVYKTKEGVPQQELALARHQAEQVISGPLTLRAGDRSWQLSQQQLRDWVRLDTTQLNGRTHLQVTVDPVQLTNVLNGFAPQINRPPGNARLKWSNNQLALLHPSQDGARLDVNASIAAIQQTAVTSDRTVQLVVQNLPAEVTAANVGSLGITSQLATGISSLHGVPQEHLHNVQVAANAATGYVVMPGEEFSFAKALGGVSEAEGYTPELVGDGETSIQGPWTGISQLSTTIFRAALQAGLPISERHPAPVRVDYYEQGQPPGIDAVVTLPGEDMRFVNDTGTAILVQVLIGTDELRVDLYGGAPDRQVQIGPPAAQNVVQPGAPLDWADPNLPAGQTGVLLPSKTGEEVTIHRQVSKGGHVVSEEDFYTKYDPLPTINVHGTKQG